MDKKLKTAASVSLNDRGETPISDLTHVSPFPPFPPFSFGSLSNLFQTPTITPKTFFFIPILLPLHLFPSFLFFTLIFLLSPTTTLFLGPFLSLLSNFILSLGSPSPHKLLVGPFPQRSAPWAALLPFGPARAAPRPFPFPGGFSKREQNSHFYKKNI